MSAEVTGADGVLLETHLPGLPGFIRGKVRDVYDLDQHLLIVTTDRLSAFDCVLPTGIPDKGRVLNLISAFWFDFIRPFCPSHLVTTDAAEIRAALGEAGASLPEEVLNGRAMLARKAKAYPVECVVRGYLEGSAWKEYRRSGSVCGIGLPAGLLQGSRLPEPIFTPSTKAASGHDENITHQEMAELVPAGEMAQLIELSLRVYTTASEHARERGILIADTKFEFGLLDGQVTMIDECLTPDSSRFWDAEGYEPGGPQPSFDKQYVRDYLDGIGWNHEPPAPALPAEVAERTAEKYREIYRRITGRELD
ncbi:MAG: phosphoribosylaminoimidazolesuccinocarboxamide synthase [Armatimonadota bacterium]